jgi:hypothetical protein
VVWIPVFIECWNPGCKEGIFHRFLSPGADLADKKKLASGKYKA